MRTLKQLFEFNTWANLRVFEACRQLEADILSREAAGTIGTIESTLKHLVQVEDHYLLMLRGLSPFADPESEEQLEGHSLPWFANRAAEIGEDYRSLIERAGEGFLDVELKVPWFDFTMSNLDGLLQVLNHSAQHRAQVLTTLGTRGIEGPDVDYVDFVELMSPQAS